MEQQSLSEDKSSALTADATNLAAFIANGTEPYNHSPEHCGHRRIAVVQSFSSWILLFSQTSCRSVAGMDGVGYSSVGC
jgi:hypothetical protein